MFTRTRTRQAVTAAFLVPLLSLFTLAPVATAAHRGVATIATGLDNPRGLAFGPDGALYVAEAGSGGAAPCFPGPEGGDVCFGASGAITRISDGRQRRVVTGLPSLALTDGTQAMGPSDVAIVGGIPVFTAGLAITGDKRDELPAAGQNAGWLLASVRGNLVRLADITGHSTATDPDGGNPNSVTVTARGAAVVDSAGNSLVSVGWDGRPTTVATFPEQLADAPPFLGLPEGTQIPAQSVPTSVVTGPDGAYYVSELTGFPYPAGQARVYRVVPGQQPTVVASGFTNIGDLAFDRNGTLYVLEISHAGLLSGDLTGALIKVGRDGAHQIVTTDLTGPGGLLIRGDNAYVADCGVCPDAGRVLRIPLR
ncbi:ScyD/ScyE family protein [Actinophytocola sediminis]